MASLTNHSGRANGRQTRRLGIVTGSGPEAGIDLFAKVLAEHRRALGDAYTGDIDAPNVTVLSVPELGHSMNLPDTEDEVWTHLQEACERVADQVDVYAIACNTLYFFEPKIRALGLSAELVSPVACIRQESQRRDGQPLALLGAAPVTDFGGGTSPYAGLVEQGVALELHSEPLRVHALVEAIKVEGRSTPKLEAEFEGLVGELTSEAALLACTELPLLSGERADIELIDVTTLLARALVGDPTLAGSGA